MAIEIELKAWVSNPDELKNKLAVSAVFLGTFEKNDNYFCQVNDAPAGSPSLDHDEKTGNPAYGVRLRKESFADSGGILRETRYVTYKTKEVRNGIEVNDEREFEVSSSDAFREFLTHIGFKERIRKRKTGSVFRYNDINAELSQVEGLGWFVELEIILSEMTEKNEQNIDKEAKELLGFLDLLGISREAIESRSYTAMLENKEQGTENRE